MHLYNATTTTFSYILVVAFYYLVACIIPVLEIFFFFSDDYMIQQKPASTLCIYHHRYTLLLHAWKKKRKRHFFFFFCLHPKNTWPSTQFSTGFLVCCSCRNCHIVIDCVWCGFNVNVEQNEVWHQHHLRQIRIVKKNKNRSQRIGSLVVPLSARRKSQNEGLNYSSFSLHFFDCHAMWRYGDASSGSDDVLPRLFLVFASVHHAVGGWPDDIYSPGEIGMLWRLWIDFHGPSTC